MTSENQSNNTKMWVLVIVVLVAVAGLGYWVWGSMGEPTQTPGQVMCTQEAKQCPDGSYVGRTGPNCAFAACPEVTNEGWKTMTDAATGVSFQYPETVSTPYITTSDWPPKVQVLNQSYTCTEAGVETERAGITEKRLVGGREYCVTTVTEGAAGSNYTQYAYAFAQGNKTVILTFTLRFVRCENYDAAQRTACETERASFNIESTVDRIARSLKTT